MRSFRHLVRPVAALATGAVVATTFAAPAQAAPDDLAGGWLQRQPTDGLVHNDQYDFDDYGLTADVAIALDGIGGHPRAERRIARALADHVDSWTTGVDFGSSDIYAGSVAKAVATAQAAGRNPRDFGGVDLVKRLNHRVSGTRRYLGRLEDRTSDTDYANTIGQAFAVLGLARARSRKAADTRRFLFRQQCKQGYFRLNFAPKDTRKQGCDAGSSDQSAPDTDVTALAVLSLNAVPHRGKRARAAIADAVGWLKRTQKRNGSYVGGPSTDSSNTNSTGLAGWALGQQGVCGRAAKAARWVHKRQVRGKVGGTPLAGEKGGIAYDPAAYEAAASDGITVETRDQWRRASTQAAPALVFLRVKQCRRR